MAGAVGVAAGVAVAVGLVTAVPAGAAAAAPTVEATAGAGTGARGRPVSPVLLAGDHEVTVAVDISPVGVVVGTSNASPPPDIPGGQGEGSGWRWIVGPGGRQLGAQKLVVPGGTTRVEIAGVTDLGEAGGVVVGAGVTQRQAVRWSVAGTQTIPLTTGPDPEVTTSAVGPGQWAVYTGGSISGTSAIVARDGARTELRGTADLDSARIVGVSSIGGPGTAVLGAVTGVGRGTTSRPVIWRDGATLTLPTRAMIDLPQPSCVSAILADGTVAYSGIVSYQPDIGFTRALSVHRGGIPGTEVALPTAGRIGSLGCSSPDTLSSDGWVAGSLLADSVAGRPATAALWHAPSGGTPTLTTIGVGPGETATTAVAVATRGRVVVVATTSDGTRLPYLWSNGARTPLPLPVGWALRTVVELTDNGLVLANVQNAAGAVRPVVWPTGA